MSAQIPFSLPVDAAMEEEDFLVTACNMEAAKQVEHFTVILLLLGGKGTGKSHLARIWRKKNDAAAINLTSFDPARIIENILWEDADKIAWDEASQKKAFHLLNGARENNLKLLITASTPVAAWVITLADLRSRLSALPVAKLRSPDDALLAGLLLKYLRDRQLRVAEDLVSYLLPRLPREGAALAEAVRLLDEASLSKSRAITIPLAKEALKNFVDFRN